jgi:hypothetical protein
MNYVFAKIEKLENKQTSIITRRKNVLQPLQVHTLKKNYLLIHQRYLTEKWIPDEESPQTAHGLPDLKLFLGPSNRCFCLFKKLFVARWTWSSSLRD